MRIVLTGGGTGGHIFPLIAVSRKLKEKLKIEAELMYIGSGARMEQDVMQNEGIPTVHVQSGKIRRYFSFQNFLDFFKLPIGIIQCLWILLKFMPDAVFSKGGYAAVPVVVAAWIYRIPVLIHESDSIPGLANRLSAKFSRRVAVGYQSAMEFFSAKKTALTGNPVREEIIGGDHSAARSSFGLSESKPTIFIVGGSQGAMGINEHVISILPEILKRAQVIHQTGSENYERVIRLAAEQGIKAGREGYLAFPFLDAASLKNAYAVADLVISRAGAGSISEIAANKKPSILIPLEGAANDHQRMNAHDIAQAEGAVVLEENNLVKHLFLQRIEKILDDKDYARSLSQKISAFYNPEASSLIANGILEMI